MTGKWIKRRQVELYMKARKKGCTQTIASAKSDISERSGRNIDNNKRTDPEQMLRWRTRTDPLEAVWDIDLKPMLEKTPDLTAITLLEYLQDKYPENYSDKVQRTLQRRIKEWKALSGPEKNVMFLQVHEPGRLGLSDFTTLKNVTVTIAGEAFDHLLYHFRLAYSRWSFIKVIQGGESFPALAEGLGQALKKLGGCPLEHRTDSLSAAFKNLSPKDQEDMTMRYDALCRHYGISASRNNRGHGHENGSVESPHGHIKKRIAQALLLRGSNNFESTGAYQKFIDNVVLKANKRNAKEIENERKTLQPLPDTEAVNYVERRAVVSSSSTIEVRRITYTVPSRLQGEALNVRIYDDRLICYLGAKHVITLERIHLSGRKRGRKVDYRHVIHSLAKKPQAFRYSKLRDDLFPDDNYRQIWKEVDKTMSPKEACKFMVGLMYLAATCDCEKALGEAVIKKMSLVKKLSLNYFQDLFCKKSDKFEDVKIIQHPLENYNQLIPNHIQEVSHAS